jgi:hypothetical protein
LAKEMDVAVVSRLWANAAVPAVASQRPTANARAVRHELGFVLFI